MLLFKVAFAVFTFVICCLAADQDILTILKQQNGISTFAGFLEQLPDVVDILNQGTFSGTSNWAMYWATQADTIKC
jgi:hypothetical protein